MEQGLEYFGVITGLVYLGLEIRQHRAMWIVGFLTSFVYIFVFFFSGFYADMGLNVYYVGISIYGFRQWRQGDRQQTGAEEEISYCHLNVLKTGIVAGMTVCAYLLLYWSLSRYTDSPVPAGDAFTTALSVTATWMLARKILEHWWFWVAANVVSAVLYYQRGLYPTCFLFICYGILAVAGWWNWRTKGRSL